MKIAVLILSTSKEPSTSNVQAMKDTFIAYCSTNKDKLNHEYMFYEYYGLGVDSATDIVKETDNFSVIRLGENDGIHYTFEKTVKAFREVNKIDNYDWFIRINISSYINIPLIDKILTMLNTGDVYTSAINSYIDDFKYANDIYPRGDFYMLSKDVYDKVEVNFDKYVINYNNLENILSINVPHVDDCLFGLCMIDGVNQYYDHIKMFAYNFVPRGFDRRFISLYAVSSRVKTLPPDATYSGYSWDDNEYRRCDGEKMKKIHDVVTSFNYSNVTPVMLRDVIIVNDSSERSRPTLFIHASDENISTFRNYLKRKRG